MDWLPLKGDAHPGGGALTNLGLNFQVKGATKQCLQPSSQQCQGMNARSLGEEDLFDLGGGNTLPVVADAHLQPLPEPTDNEAKAASFGRGLHTMLNRVLHQGLKGKR